MADHISEDHPLVAELADARERIDQLEAEVKALRTQTPEQREEAEKEAQGRAILEAFERGRDKNVTRRRF